MASQTSTQAREPILVRLAVPIVFVTIASAATVAGLGIFTGAPWEAEYRSVAGLAGPERTAARLANSQIKSNNWEATLRLALGIGATGGALVGLGRFELSRSEQKREAARQMADRFVAAISLVASTEAAAAIGGLYSLEGIFLESPDYHQRVVDVVCAYIRGFRAPVPASAEEAAGYNDPAIPETLRAALDVLRRCRGRDLAVTVDLSAANLHRADLRKANLREANLQGADLREADLRKANLRGADLREANLEGAKLEWADLRGAILRGADLQGADLRWANLQGADLREANLVGANLEGKNLREANLREANLRGAILREADLQGADLLWANLQGADLREANLREANLQGADLQGADLREADLRKANLDRAILRGAHLEGVRYDKETVWPEGFTPPPSAGPPASPPPSATGE